MLTNIRLWTVEEYHRLIETEILRADERVELLEGQIIAMSPLYPPHASTTQYASDYLKEVFGKRVIIRVQLPITLPPNSEPQPDIAVVKVDERSYFYQHPQVEDIFLVIEVADSSLQKDKKRKALTYAQAKIGEYWVLDVKSRQVYVFRQPEGDKYQQEIVLSENDTLSLLAFPELKIQVSSLFP